MCRVLTYLGKPILLDDLLYNPDSSLVKQSYDPRHMSHIQNLAGFGIAAWSDSSHATEKPFLYHSVDLPFFDNNLKNLALKLRSNCLLAHVRGVSYSLDAVVSHQNVHPFMYKDYKLALAHNGQLEEHDKMRVDILQRVRPEIAQHIKGTTDSELIYALLLSQFDDTKADHTPEEVGVGVIQTLRELKEIRHRHSLTFSSPINLFITNGEYLILTRFAFNYGAYLSDIGREHFSYHTLWYTYGEEYGYFDGEYKMRGGGKKQSVSFASEPLTRNVTSWIEVPEYSLVTAQYQGDEIVIHTRDIDI